MNKIRFLKKMIQITVFLNETRQSFGWAFFLDPIIISILTFEFRFQSWTLLTPQWWFTFTHLIGITQIRVTSATLSQYSLEQFAYILHIVWSKLGHYVTLTTTIRVPGEGRCTPLQHFPTSLVSEVTFYMGQGSAKTRALISRGARCGCAAAHLYFEGIMWEFLICWVSKIFITKRYFSRPYIKNPYESPG